MDYSILFDAKIGKTKRLLVAPLPSVDGANWIQLTKGYFVLVDRADYEIFGGLNWTALVVARTVYAYCTRRLEDRPKNVLLHRAIMNAPDGMEVDHCDGNGLNCRRENLRICSLRDNHCNVQKSATQTSSRFKGVCWDRARNRWHARVKVHQVTKFLGRFGSEEEAAHAYDKAAKSFFGEFARLNFAEAS